MLLDLTPSASFNYPPHAAAFVRNKYLHILAHATHFSAKKRKEEKKVKQFHIWACDAGGTSRRWLNRGDRLIQHCPTGALGFPLIPGRARSGGLTGPWDSLRASQAQLLYATVGLYSLPPQLPRVDAPSEAWLNGSAPERVLLLLFQRTLSPFPQSWFLSHLWLIVNFSCGNTGINHSSGRSHGIWCCRERGWSGIKTECEEPGEAGWSCKACVSPKASWNEKANIHRQHHPRHPRWYHNTNPDVRDLTSLNFIHSWTSNDYTPRSFEFRQQTRKRRLEI